MDIVQIAEELLSLPSNGTRVPGFRGKVLVDGVRLTELTEELRNSVPATIREAQEIIKQKDSIVNQARLESDRIKEAAEEEAVGITATAMREHESKVDESEVVKSAEAKAQEIENDSMLKAQQIVQEAQKRAYHVLSEADSTAGTIRDGADLYAREVLFALEEQLAAALGKIRKGIDVLGLEAEAQKEPEENHVPA